VKTFKLTNYGVDLELTLRNKDLTISISDTTQPDTVSTEISKNQTYELYAFLKRHLEDA